MEQNKALKKGVKESKWERQIIIFYPKLPCAFFKIVFLHYYSTLSSVVELIYCSSGSDFGKVLVPAPVSDPNSDLDQDHI